MHGIKQTLDYLHWEIPEVDDSKPVKGIHPLRKPAKRLNMIRCVLYSFFRRGPSY